ncbi:MULTISPECIES: hypothetical protein [Dactylosporangium]|uniref:Lipoprotein n=2 Tax=Dactylosporangium TaxID=35753 RepID=A0A9W6NJA5_9ACTN|nr:MULTISPECIES: hypothetical protein [Dactylosporangium]UAB96864.1 hypothetical protein Dvina_01115 [Dactylosporangium vinaceum]UWZ45201.1 hypothetical protein Dmats_01160 [Dactylosporangium matsuzakiense]GLK98840.1 hypothetical protein GCM10017581_005810 [Dactylosporangium matsuzakiense]
MRAVRLLAATLLALGVAACGPDGVEPKTWAKQVCTALTPWRAEIADLTSRAQQQLGAATTPAQSKTNIVDLLAGAEASSEKARAGVSGAGVPAVDDGPKVAEQFTASLTKARDAYGNAKRTVSGLATDKTFYAEVKKAFTTLNTEYGRSAIDPAHVGPEDLQKAFDEVPECR